MPEFDQNLRNRNELNKFLDDGSGNPAVRVNIKETRMSENSVREWKDHHGIVIMRLDEATGNLAITGAFKKL